MKQKILDHLVMMAQSPGWKQYAWDAAKWYANLRDLPELADLPRELAAEMLRIGAEKQKAEAAK